MPAEWAPRAWLVLCAVGLLSGCGHVSPIRPVPKGELQLQATLGGPIASWGIPFPSPHLSAGASYGLTDWLDASAHLHLSTLVAGVGGIDVGASALVLDDRGAVPAITLSGRAYGFTDLEGVAGFLEGTGTVSWRLLEKRLWPYAACTVFAQVNDAPLIAPAVGALYWFDGFHRMGLQLEAQWIQPGLSTGHQAVPWVGIAGQGALSVVMSVRFMLEKP